MLYIQSYLQYLQSTRRLSVHTIDAYSVDMKQFTDFVFSKYQIEDPKNISHLHIRDWVLTLHEDGKQTKSVKRKLSCLQTWFKYLLKNQYITYDPMLKVSTPKLPKRLPSVIQEQQMERLFALIDFGSDYKGLRNQLILELLYATGIRRQELMQIQMSHVQLERGLIKIIGKGNKERLVPIPNYLRPVLSTYFAARTEAFPSNTKPFLLLTDQGEELYPGLVYRVVHKYLSMVSSAQQRSPHTLRHSFATHLSNQGADLNAIKSLLGHSSLASTQVYMHNSINRLKAVYDQAHPKSKNDTEDADH
jgi:integrase/recombinase XerC